jgi:flagellar assembly factor FliW
MPETQSKYFGRLSYQAEAVIDFPAGLPGFEDQHRFLLIEQPVNRPLAFLQSMDRPELCFVTVPAQIVIQDYCVSLSQQECDILGLEAGSQARAGGELLVLAILAVEPDGGVTANLRAPLVIHSERRRAVQAIPEECAYSHRHPLTSEAQEAPCS